MIQRRAAVLAIAVLAMSNASQAARNDSPRMAVLSAEIRLDIDEQGRVTAIEPTSPMPGAVEQAIRRHARAWRFEVPTRDGRPVGGTTYARMGICAMAGDNGDLMVSIGNPVNGPGSGPRTKRSVFLPPASGELLQLGRLEMVAVYDVGADGRAKLVSIASTPRKARGVSGVEMAFGRWLASQRFRPELLDGQPVATRMRMPVTFTWAPASRDEGLAIMREAVATSPSCRVLLDDGKADDRPVAVDSRFRLQPSG